VECVKKLLRKAVSLIPGCTCECCTLGGS